MESRLRDLMIAEAGDPPHRVTVEAVRRRAMRRWAAQAGAAGLAVVLAVGLGVGVAAGLDRAGTSPASSTGQHAGPPRYYVTQYYDPKARKVVLAVRARASGRVTAVVGDPMPGPASSCGQGTAGLAAADDQTFFMTCSAWRSAPPPGGQSGVPKRFRRPGKITSIQSRIYRFQVTSAGRIAGYSLVKGGTLNGWADNIAVTADGSKVAAEVIAIPRSGQMATNQVPEGIFVINTVTGARALWHTGYVPGAAQYVSATDISITGNGHDLVVLGPRCRRSLTLIHCNGHADMQVRAYSPADGGGSLQDGRVLLQDSALTPRGTSLSDAFISPGGTSLATALTDCPAHGPCTLTVARFPVVTVAGSPAGTGGARVLYQVQSGSRFAGIFFRFFSADPSGRYLILDAGAGSKRVNGWIDHGRLVPLAPANGNIPEYEAW
jgi:hypothetical protein